MTTSMTRTQTLSERIMSLALVEQRRAREKHGAQLDVPLGMGRPWDVVAAERAKEATDRAFREGWGTWHHIIREEVMEAFAESDPNLFIAEALQSIAMFASAIEATMHQHPDVTLPPPF